MERRPEVPVAELEERLARIDPRLDDVARQRVLARIHERISTEAHARPAAWRRAWIGLALAAAAALALGWPRATPHKRFARQSVPVRNARTVVSVPTPAPTLVPYLVSGCDAARAELLLDRPARRIELAAGERMLAALGNRAHLGLEGPAQLELRFASAARTELVLSQGTLFGDYDHHQGGVLVIDSPGARTEVVGTLFSVHADGVASRIAVARGAVRVRTASTEVPLAGGQSWSTRIPAPAPITAAEAKALNEHDRSLAPPSGAHGLIGLTGARLRVEVAGHMLAKMPVWALLPAGANTITLRDARDQGRELRTTVRAAERTEVQVAGVLPLPSTSSAPPAPATRPSPAPSAPVPAPTRADPVAGPPRNAETLYAEAEAAMRAADRVRAAQRLSELVDQHADAPVVDLALYDLAQMAFRDSDYGSAERWLGRLAAHDVRSALREPAQYLRCRVAYAKGVSAGAEQCLVGFRSSFPDSIHGAEVLAVLATLRLQREGCAAEPLLAEYVARYPNGPFANEARTKRAMCAPVSLPTHD